MTTKLIKVNESLFNVKTHSKKEKITLHYSNLQEGWTKPGSKSSSLESTGDGFIFKDHFLGIELEIDYSQMAELQALLYLMKEEINIKEMTLEEL